MLVHGSGTQARQCEEGNAVEQQSSQQGGQDHIPEPDSDEHLQSNNIITNMQDIVAFPQLSTPTTAKVNEIRTAKNNSNTGFIQIPTYIN